MNMRLKLAIVVLVGTAALPSWAATPWSAFHGFYPGMSKGDALKAGAERCRQGQGVSEHSDSIYCFVPANLLTVGKVTAQEGKLEFKDGKFGRVDNVSLRFKENEPAVIRSLSGLYGQGKESYDGNRETNITEWERGDPYSVELRSSGKGRWNAIYVDITFDPAAAKARKAASSDKQRMTKALDGFKQH